MEGFPTTWACPNMIISWRFQQPQSMDLMAFNGNMASKSMISAFVQKMVQVCWTKMCQSIGIEAISCSDKTHISLWELLVVFFILD